MGKTKQELNLPKSVGLEKSVITKNRITDDHIAQSEKKIMVTPRGYRPLIMADYKPLPRFKSGCGSC